MEDQKVNGHDHARVTVRRDPEWEVQWLAVAELSVPLDDGARAQPPEIGFAARVAARLAEGEQRCGDAWTRAGLAALVEGIAEHAADAAAFALLAQQALPLEGFETEGDRDAISGLLRVAGTGAAGVHAAVTLLERRLQARAAAKD